MSAPSFAYLFERFPAFTQTFCAREVAEMFRQQMEPALFSIRESDAKSFAPELAAKTRYLPGHEELIGTARTLREEKKLPRNIAHALNRWGESGDKTRVYEAQQLGPILQEKGIRHVHAHFGGMAARTAYWLKKFYGVSYSFTGHANDIFLETDFPVTLEDLVREARCVVTVSDFSRDWLREKFRAHAQKIHRVYNGIHVENFPAATFDEGIPKIVSVGRLIEKKGFAILLDACARLRESGAPFYCRIIGEGPLEAALRAQITRLGLTQHVALEGARSEAEVLGFLRGARVFALPCVRETGGGMDNLPTVIMEAMACGLPVISTSLAGVPEMVRAGETGMLVAENDAAPLAEALKELLNDREFAQRLGQAGAATAREKFSIAVTTRELKHLLVRHGRARPSLAAYRADPALLRKRLAFF